MRIAGQDRVALQPRSEEELSECLARCRAEGRRVLTIGTGCALREDLQLAECDQIVSSEHLRGIIEYEPAEGVVTAWAGTRLSELRKTVEAGGHLLTPTLPLETERTLGGVIASGESGPDRLRCGPLRNHVLGVRVADGDGLITKSGGRLVKNVTGFDLPRLHTGARGSLGVIVEASLRLFPLPAVRTRWWLNAQSGTHACRVALQIRTTRAQPLSMTAFRIGNCWRLHVELAGHAAVIEDEERILRRISTDFHSSGAQSPDLEQLKLRLRNRRSLTCQPSQIEELIDQLDADPAAGDLLVEPGIATVRWTGARPLPDLPALSASHRALEQRIREALDPHSTFLRG
jgi:glycolate oxidase FAD binding subunit